MKSYIIVSTLLNYFWAAFALLYAANYAAEQIYWLVFALGCFVWAIWGSCAWSTANELRAELRAARKSPRDGI